MAGCALRFVLSGKVQGVKMRRYVEAAARHFGVRGFTINTAGGDVYGEAAGGEAGAVDSFAGWLRGEWEPKEYHAIKPTPVGTAYPLKARVLRAEVEVRAAPSDLGDTREPAPGVALLPPAFQEGEFQMVRDDAEAALLEPRLVGAPLSLPGPGPGWAAPPPTGTGSSER